MKQTSIEWLIKELEYYGSPKYLNLAWKTFDKLIEQAKEMHKQEVTNCNHLEISDEEIQKEAKNHHNYYEWSAGAKWYREQLKQRNENPHPHRIPAEVHP